MAIFVACPCGAPYSMGDEWAGRPVRCSRCGQVFVVPASPAVAPPQPYRPAPPPPNPLDNLISAGLPPGPPAPIPAIAPAKPRGEADYTRWIVIGGAALGILVIFIGLVFVFGRSRPGKPGKQGAAQALVPGEASWEVYPSPKWDFRVAFPPGKFRERDDPLVINGWPVPTDTVGVETRDGKIYLVMVSDYRPIRDMLKKDWYETYVREMNEELGVQPHPIVFDGTPGYEASGQMKVKGLLGTRTVERHRRTFLVGDILYDLTVDAPPNKPLAPADVEPFFSSFRLPLPATQAPRRP